MFVDTSPQCEISAVNIDLDLEHSFIGDLTITLVSPTGHEVTLRDQRGSRRRQIVGNYPQTLDVENQEVFEQLGMSGFGLWRLKVIDTFERDIGQVNSWGVNITCADQCEDGARSLSDRPCVNEGNPTEGVRELCCED
jgi:serine protease